MEFNMRLMILDITLVSITWF